MTEIEYTRKCSQYLSILLRNNPDYEEWLLGESNIKRKYPLTGLYSSLGSEAAKANSFQDLLGIFRRFKQRHFLRIGARDLCGYAGLAETTGQLSDLASVALQVGLDVLAARPDWWAWDDELNVWRRLRGKVPLVALGLGKLGGWELNYVSDIDLIFLHLDCEGDGEGDGEDLTMLLSRLTHRLSRLISDQFEGDRVFHVDFRLRPQGKQGMLVPCISGALEHYLLRGRAWERQMLLKCRPVAGERSEGTAFVHELRPFVFRRFLDFQAIVELREMRNRILSEVIRYTPGKRNFDVKLGIGGIREVEFLVQSMQLVYGGRHLELDEPNTLKCLEKLAGLGLLPQGAAGELKGSYTFLRNVEHYIQLDQNRQTQKLPNSEEGRMRLVFAMGFGDDEVAFLKALEMHCSIVHSRFRELFQEAPVSNEEKDFENQKTRVSTGEVQRSYAFPTGPIEKLQETLKAYPASVKFEIVQKILEKFSSVSDRQLLERILVRVDTYFGRAARRTGLIKLFETAEPWLEPFCLAIASSELVAELLSHNPSLVEGHAIRSGVLIPAPQWEQSSGRLVDRAGEYGEKLEWIRRLKNERIIQLALADLGGLIDFAALEEEQTSLADFVIRNTLEAVKENLGLGADLPMSVIGMGKLGSGEMSYLSDLDLVFVYAPGAGGSGDQIPGEVIRLIQRFMNMLSTPLQEGPGYPMDVRLRPTGTHGPLVVARKSWLEYYENQADIWEIQALLRIRHIAGDPELGRWIDDKAAEICCRPRAPESVWPRICHLRNRIEKERAEETEKEIDLKLGMGGLADIEFMVQGRMLVCPQSSVLSPQSSVFSPQSLPCRSVRRLVKEFLKDISKPGIDGIKADEITAAFGALRALDHRTRLHTNSSAAKLDPQRFEAMVSLGLWPPHFDGSSIETWQDIMRLRREVRGVFKGFCP
ncbi:(Glutamate--ammonia-ligase) adenylyltransferase [Syntrophobacter sp. SbD1]|nr:(Glutamate--ammonia-ligase) adenylyltransferase [Syntrophobacter sp. SbD1]